VPLSRDSRGIRGKRRRVGGTDGNLLDLHSEGVSGKRGKPKEVKEKKGWFINVWL